MSFPFRLNSVYKGLSVISFPSQHSRPDFDIAARIVSYIHFTPNTYVLPFVVMMRYKAGTSPRKTCTLFTVDIAQLDAILWLLLPDSTFAL